MADPNKGQQIANAWEHVVGNRPEDNIFEQYWLLDRLKKGEAFLSVDGGRLVELPLDYKLNTTVSSYTDTDTISTSRIDVFDVAQFNWKEYAGTVVQSELEDAVNQGGGAKFPLLASKLDNLKNSFFDTINVDCFSDGTGNASKTIGGLQLIISTTPTTGTVGGINRANFSFWRNQQTSGAKTTSAFDNLRASMRSIYNQCSNGVSQEHPDFAVTTRTVFEGFEGLLTANERFTAKDVGEGGFKNEALKYKGSVIAYDNDCPSGNLYFGNTRFLKLAYQKGRWMKNLDEVAPANQTVRVFRVVTIANLVTNNSRRLGVVSAIT